MIIGARRTDEARVFDSFAGYHSFHCEETQEEYGSFEVYFFDPLPKSATIEDVWEDYEPGWYWVACFPGCMPDGEPSGPFGSSREALHDADEWNPEFDADFED